MADLTANDISRLLAPTNEGVKSLTVEQERTTDYIENLNSTLAEIGVAVDKLFNEVSTGNTEGKKPKKPKTLQAAKPGDNPLDIISSHLKDIKDFLVETFKKGPKSAFGGDTKKPPPGTKESPTDMVVSKMDEGSKTAMGWLAGLFAVGALGELSKVLGIGAAGGAAGLLAKVAGKIFKFTGPVLRRIPIIGSLFSFYEAYKKLKAGGIDNTIFGLMDFAAGIAYMVPGLGTGIGIGIDVLQYFLKNKADEFKKESGDVSFFGSMYDKLMTWLYETPMFDWMIGLGMSMKAFWNNPTYETFDEMIGRFGDVMGPLRATLQMFSTDAGAALGLTDESGAPQGLFSWLNDKVEEYIITPVMDFIGGVIQSIGDGISSLVTDVTGFIEKALTNMLPEGYIKDTVMGVMGFDAYKEAPKAKEVDGMRDAVKDLAKHVGGKFKEEDYLKFLDTATPQQLFDANTMLRDKAKKRNILDDFNKIPEQEKLPTPEEVDKEIINKAFGGVPNQSTVNQTQINTYVVPDAPSGRYTRRR